MKTSKLFVLVLLTVFMVSMVAPLFQIQPVKAQTDTNWLVTSATNVYGYSGSGSVFDDLSLSTGLSISAVASGDGYYLVGLTQTDWPEYSGPTDVPHLWKYDGATWTALGMNTTQVTSITSYFGEFVIGGWYLSFSPGYRSGVVETYDGVTLTDITATVYGEGNRDPIYGACTNGDIMVFGMSGQFSSYGYMRTWDGVTLSTVWSIETNMRGPSTIAWNGQFFLGAYDGWNYMLQYFPENGTVNDLNFYDNGDYVPAGFPGNTGISKIAWNGTHFLILDYDRLGTHTIGKLFDGDTFTTVIDDDTANYVAAGWNGAFWLIGGDTKLLKLDGNDLTTVSSDVGFTITNIMPNILQLSVICDPIDNMRFTAMGEQLITPVIIPMAVGGEVPIQATPSVTHGGGYYVFDHAVASAGGGQTTESENTFTVDVGMDTTLQLVYGLSSVPTVAPSSPPGGGGPPGDLNANGFTVNVTVLNNGYTCPNAWVSLGLFSRGTDNFGKVSFSSIQSGTYPIAASYQGSSFTGNLKVDHSMSITIDLYTQEMKEDTPPSIVNTAGGLLLNWLFWLVLFILFLLFLVFLATRKKKKKK